LLGTHVADKTKHNHDIAAQVVEGTRQALKRRAGELPNVEDIEVVVESILRTFPHPHVEWLTTEQAARYTNFSTQHLEIARHRADGSGPHFVKHPKSVRYKREWLDDWMEAQRVDGEGQPQPTASRRRQKTLA
jgi:hypothetical protein